MLPLPLARASLSVIVLQLLLHVGSSTNIATQRTTLEDFYKSTSGPTWSSACTAGWMSTDAAPCTWFGVSCDASQNVVQLQLGNCGLGGTLPLSLTALTHVQMLQLNRNALTGTLPREWAKFSELSSLTLSHNFLTGGVPVEWYSMQSQTFNLDLSHNKLSGGLPLWNASIFSDSVGSVDLSNNRFSGSLPVWSGVYQVAFLNLSNNQLSGSIHRTWRTISVGTLDLSGNRFSGHISSWEGRMTNLYLQRNQFSGNLSFLDTLIDQSSNVDLSSNAFTGDIPQILYANYQCSDFESPCNCSLNLQNNFLQGAIPSSYCELSMGINLDGNCLTNTTTPSNCYSPSATCRITASTQREGQC